MARVLVVDDEESVRTTVRMLLENEGHEPLMAASGAEGLAIFREQRPDLVILDVMMRNMDGFEVCEAIRAEDEFVPILFLSARGDIVDKGVGFKMGGDDYLVKPFLPQELAYRIRALLRRNSLQKTESMPTSLRYRDLCIDVKRRRVTVAGKFADLTPKEFDVLLILASSPGEVFTSKRLINEAWGPEFVEGTTSLAVIVRRIREKIEDDPSSPKYLQTVWRVGYRLGD